MRDSEALQLVGVLNATWPREALEQETIQVYASKLSTLDVEVATKTVDVLIVEEERFPPLAKIFKVYNEVREIERRKRSESHGLPEADGAPPPPEWFAMMDKVRGGVLKDVP